MHILPEAAQAGHPACPRCHTPLRVVNVHGHDQCVVCKSNIRECCEGEVCQSETSMATEAPAIKNRP